MGVRRPQSALPSERQAALARHARALVPGRRLSARGSRFQVSLLLVRSVFGEVPKVGGHDPNRWVATPEMEIDSSDGSRNIYATASTLPIWAVRDIPTSSNKRSLKENACTSKLKITHNLEVGSGSLAKGKKKPSSVSN